MNKVRIQDKTQQAAEALETTIQINKLLDDGNYLEAKQLMHSLLEEQLTIANGCSFYGECISPVQPWVQSAIDNGYTYLNRPKAFYD